MKIYVIIGREAHDLYCPMQVICAFSVKEAADKFVESLEAGNYRVRALHGISGDFDCFEAHECDLV